MKKFILSLCCVYVFSIFMGIPNMAFANTVCDSTMINVLPNTIQFSGTALTYSLTDSDQYNMAFIANLDCNNLGELSPSDFEPFIADQDFWNGLSDFYTPNPPKLFIRSVENLLDGRYLVKVGSIEEVCFADAEEYVYLGVNINGGTRLNDTGPFFGRVRPPVPVQGIADLYADYLDFDISFANTGCLYPMPNFSLTKSATPLTGTPGIPATFTITITNSGAGNTQGTYTVTDTLPAGLVFTATGSDTRCSAVAQVVTCTDTTVLVPTASTSFDIAVAIANVGSYDNTATVSGGAATTATSNTVTVVRTAPASGGGGGGGTGSVLGGGCIVGQTWNGVKCVIPSTISPTSTPVTPKSTTSTSSLRTSRLGLLWQTGSDTFGSCEYPILTTPIKFGVQNNSDDVKFLEQFLNTYENEQLAINGIYEKTDFDAVVRWQEKYFDAVLKPWNLTKGTGYVYKTSLAQIARQYQTFCTSPAPVPASPIAVTHDIPMKPIAATGTRIRIPSIKLDTTVYTTGTLQQAKGNVWHSPDTEMPDQGGNTVLVGHRYINLVRDAQGNVVRIAPKPGIFFELPNVPMGADIYVTYNGKEHHYQVTRSFEVMPSEIWVEDATISPTLTLYTCTPLYTHNKRHVLRAELVK